MAANQHPEIMAVATQTLRLAATDALAAGIIRASQLEAAIAAMQAPRTGRVTPTVFGAVGRRQPYAGDRLTRPMGIGAPARPVADEADGLLFTWPNSDSPLTSCSPALAAAT